MLYNFAKVLRIVFALTGAVSIIFSLDRLALTKSANKMTTYIEKLKESLGQNERKNE